MESVRNMHAEVTSTKTSISSIKSEVEKYREEIQLIKKQVSAHGVGSNRGGKTAGGKYGDEGQLDKSGADDNNNGNEGISRTEFNELKDKVSILGKKTNSLELLANDLRGETEELRNDTSLLLENNENLQNQCNDNSKSVEELRELIKSLSSMGNGGDSGNSNQGVSSDGLGKILEDLLKVKNDLREFKKELNELKKDRDSSSRTSIDEEKGNRFEKAALTYSNSRFKDEDRLKDLSARVEYL